MGLLQLAGAAAAAGTAPGRASASASAAAAAMVRLPHLPEGEPEAGAACGCWCCGGEGSWVQRTAAAGGGTACVSSCVSSLSMPLPLPSAWSSLAGTSSPPSVGGTSSCMVSSTIGKASARGGSAMAGGTGVRLGSTCCRSPAAPAPNSPALVGLPGGCSASVGCCWGGGSCSSLLMLGRRCGAQPTRVEMEVSW